MSILNCKIYSKHNNCCQITYDDNYDKQTHTLAYSLNGASFVGLQMNFAIVKDKNLCSRH